MFQNYPVTTDDRDRLAEHLWADGIETLISWPIPLHQQKGLGLDHWNLPHTEALCRRVLSLPLHPELDYDQIDVVADSVRQFFGAR